MANEIGALIGLDLARIQNPGIELGAPLINPLSTTESGDQQQGFGASLKLALQGVNDKDRVASERMAEVDSGRSDDLVGAMLASQDASLSFSMLMQVRNKVVGAMDELIKLQL